MKTMRKFCLGCAVSLVLLTAAESLPGTVSYRYDAAGRLIAADYGNGVTVRYTYDKMGNRLTETIEGKKTTAGESREDVRTTGQQSGD